MPAHLGRHAQSNDLRVRALCNRGLWNMCLPLGRGEMTLSFYAGTLISVARFGMDHDLLARGLDDRLERNGVLLSFHIFPNLETSSCCRSLYATMR